MAVLILTGNDLIYRFYNSGYFTCEEYAARLTFPGVIIVLLIALFYSAPYFINKRLIRRAEQIEP